MALNPQETYDQPLVIETHGGEVVITGPGATGIALTAQAAAVTAERLAEAAARAAAGEFEVHPFAPWSGSAAI